MFCRYFLVIILAISYSAISFAGNGDTIHVLTHNQVTVVTDPSHGYNNYESWGVFPDANTTYRKVILTLHYECPNGIACGEWDYIDAVSIKRTGGMSGTSKDLEIARYITPYGNTFSQTWFSEFKIDVTDFDMFLHDSVEIEYQHGGYETNVSKGWSVTVDFACIEGIPAMEPVAITKLWNGSFPFGNSADPIENYLAPISFTSNPATNLSRIRIIQSGHGYDDHECAEFCSKQRFLYFDDTLKDTRDVWKKCGDNPIYPQGGTWIYDRANWCPGLPVRPDVYDFPVSGNSTHSVNIDMQPYVSANPSANYYIQSQLIEYKTPVFANDASIEDVYTPSTVFEYSRMNPICDNPHLVLKNNGNQPLTSTTINYGLEGLPTYQYNWTGNLAMNQTEEVLLSNVLMPDASHTSFKAFLSLVNGQADEYGYDDTVRTTALIPQVMDSAIIFYFKTNNNSFENSYQLTDENGTVLYERPQFSLDDVTSYKDTFNLTPGCYTLKFIDTGGDGLSFWANPDQGSGFAKFIKFNNQPVKIFNADFGNTILFNFTVAPSVISGISTSPETDEYAEVFPNPTAGPLTAEIRLKKAEAVTLELYNQLGQLVYESKLPIIQHQFADIDMSKFSGGYYTLQVKTSEKIFTKKISLVK